MEGVWAGIGIAILIALIVVAIWLVVKSSQSPSIPPQREVVPIPINRPSNKSYQYIIEPRHTFPINQWADRGYRWPNRWPIRPRRR